MSSPHQYHRPMEPDSGHLESDDVSLDELDPIAGPTLTSTSLRYSNEKSRTDHQYESSIPLRTLPIGRPGGSWNSAGSADRATGSESDQESLLQDQKMDLSENWKAADVKDSRPQLGRRGRRRHQRQESTASTLSSKLRLPSFRMSVQLSTPGQEVVAGTHDDTELSNRVSREILVNQPQPKKYPANTVSNAKYTPWSFLPRTLYNEFSFFLNIYFLLVALSQIIPYLRIGYMSTYTVPLAVVLTITIGKEAVDDIARRRRDAEANDEPYTVLCTQHPTTKGRKGLAARSAKKSFVGGLEIGKRSRDLKVGDILKLEKNQRLPADVIILQSIPNDNNIGEAPHGHDERAAVQRQSGPLEASTSDQSETELFTERAVLDGAFSGETFIRTDQLDGETDWKLRLPASLSQGLPFSDLNRLTIAAGAPNKNVNDFVGTIELRQEISVSYDPHVAHQTPGSEMDGHVQAHHDKTPTKSAPLTIDNTAWANTILASNTTTLAVIIYSGRQTRSAMSTSPSRSKTGLLELEINTLTKILCALTLTLSIILVALEGFEPTNKKPWYVAIMIYLILFSTIIPISLRVNLDMAKTVYAYFIERDQGIPGTVVRTSTIPEDLGRIEYLLSDKTGTLTRNEMELRKIHIGTVSYAGDAMEEVRSYVRQAFAVSSNEALQPNKLVTASSTYPSQASSGTTTRTRREIGSRVRDLILALALCHNVTPTTEEIDGKGVITYQASSPDEIAIVQFTESVGLRLLHRDRKTIVLQSAESALVVIRVNILDVFPFTSDSKRMGIIVQFRTGLEALGPSRETEDEYWFYQKGADTVMSSIVAANDWLDEETANMARDGLRTLVVGRKRLSIQQYRAFAVSYREASLALQNREGGMAAVVKEHLEHNLELVGVTGVEDKLQKDVKPSLELLRNAGVKIWMLTGDKVETARCVAVSAKLVARGQYIHTIAKLRHKSQGQDALDFMRNKTDACMLIDGESLSLMLTHLRTPFISLAVLLPAVIACRCSPTQKAAVASLIRQHTKKRICCIGDGGNDVSMIQAADVGIGLVGKEGRQASLAADFSITQFSHLTKLLVWHGRNSYKRSAKLAQFIIHRGLIISVCQTMYSIAGRFDPKGLFKDWLLVGYATVYTMTPVFSLVLDRDVDEKLANLYPELYKELKTGQSLSYKTFFTWVLVSIYQGIIIQGLTQLLVGAVDGPRMLSVSFTVLVLNELIMVAVAVTTWHPIMILSILGTGALYGVSVPFLGRYFDLHFVASWAWVWRIGAVAAISLVPVWGGKVIRRTWKPPSYRKIRGI